MMILSHKVYFQGGSQSFTILVVTMDYVIYRGVPGCSALKRFFFSSVCNLISMPLGF